MTAFGSIELAVEAIRSGAEDFVTKPVAIDHLHHVLFRVAEGLRLENDNRALRRETRSSAELFWGESPVMARLLADSREAAASEALVVVGGESGTGKGALARQIHLWSSRARFPFVNVNCAGLSRDLLESELFGHERGAFTGAGQAKAGLFEVAHRGTLFLDEVAEIDLALQPRLLKAIEEKTFHRVGGVTERSVDCRVIAATNRDLAAEVAAGRFRADFYYRLNVLSLKLPALRDRPGDVPPLAARFLAEFDARAGHRARRFDPAAERILAAYAWPGNVRELRNLTERLSILSRADIVDAAGVARFLGVPRDSGSRLRTLEEKENEYIDEVLRLTGGNKTAAADILGITRNTLYARIRPNGPEDESIDPGEEP